MYTTIKLIHIGSALLSFVGFFIRGILMLRQSPLMTARLTKIAPHIIDTILLVSAIALVFFSAHQPLGFNWLSAKILGLLIYIGLGLWAFRFGKTMPQKRNAWVAALFVFILIIIAAITKPF